MKFAKVTFWIAGVWGIAVITPLFFLLSTANRLSPPPVTHPEYYYGFTSVALAFQLVFLIIASNPERFRPMMIPSVAEKFGYTTVVLLLYSHGRVDARMLLFGAIDFAFGLAFVIAFLVTQHKSTNSFAASSSRSSRF